MVFSSLVFIFAFLPLFFLFYYTAGKLFGIKGKNTILFLFSLVFYAWGEPLYILLMFYSTALDYICGIQIEKAAQANNAGRKKLFLWISLIGNIGSLAIFKYLGFAALTVRFLFGLDFAVPELVLPIGISFYTFQTMSYSIDVYREKIRAQKNIIHFGAYVAMFPQLIAGPVVRYETIADQLDNRKETVDDFAQGLRRFIVGLAKKTLIANTMATVVDSLFAYSPSALGSLGTWVAILSYTFQIYFDFSGYSDMAIGMGRMMGFHYLENFNYPYIANSISDFWRRWHISMSTFFRDYVYIPLGGNRVPIFRWIYNVMLVWFLTGLWHGASWNFVLWGLYFGVILIIEKFVLSKLLKRLPVLSHIYSLLLIVYGWVIFRCEDFAQISEFTKGLFGRYGFYGAEDTPSIILLQRSDVNTVFLITFAAAILFSMPVSQWLKKKFDGLSSAAGYALDFSLVLFFFLCSVQLALGAYNPFIYFRF